MHLHMVCFIYEHKQKHTGVSFLLSIFLKWKCACQCHEPSLYHTCFLRPHYYFFFFNFFPFLSISLQNFCQSLNVTTECDFTMQLLQSCHPLALTIAAALGTDFAALLHSLLLPFHAPCWESFQESCLWLLAVDTLLKAGFFWFFGIFIFPLSLNSLSWLTVEDMCMLSKYFLWRSFTAGSQQLLHS